MKAFLGSAVLVLAALVACSSDDDASKKEEQAYASCIRGTPVEKDDACKASCAEQESADVVNKACQDKCRKDSCPEEKACTDIEARCEKEAVAAGK